MMPRLPLPKGMEEAEVIEGWRTPEGARIAAIRILLDEGWKTYWRSPGEAGIPPQFDFTASENVAGVEVLWPRPEVFEQNGMRTLGYHDEVVLPLAITPTDPERPVNLAIDLDFGICQEICVPVSVAVSAELDGPDEAAPAIEAALTAQPRLSDINAQCIVEPIADGMRVTARMPVPASGAEPVAVFELDHPGIWVSEAQTHREGDTLVSMAEFVPGDGQPFPLDAEKLRITLFEGGDALELDGCED
ncbi:protein-disulfide reductase DsbD domain-containing protein [Pseudothioclava arenosa]|uniref:Thiol:disulfide interchange protein DsbD N-terminal domain-containing protein n=1 Tax=Pseudothioclava arenosa TaxID=1795308 RepID=A0A2A4CLJ0_9RHOB|nr:protein-disulfide reductase DsbD domain-containing protein [Pseudothioclava arenosa]PCD76111.1 hypothetical protein CLN94_11430 [Pseudothioclava arenosa]